MDDPYKFSGIAHSSHEFWSPVSRAKLETIASVMHLPRGAKVVDFGCGNGAMLLALCRRSHGPGLGLDRSPYAGKAFGNEPGIEFRSGDATELAPDGLFDLAICSGATGIFGGFAGALAAMPAFVKPGGLLLIGEGFWASPPDPAYCEATGIEPGEMMTHFENTQSVRAAGLALLYSCTSNQDEWDEYEGRYAAAIERFVAENPDDQDAEEMLKRSRDWNEAYLRWGRQTLGFGFYLARQA